MPGTGYTEMIMIVPNFSKYSCIVFGFVSKTHNVNGLFIMQCSR